MRILGMVLLSLVSLAPAVQAGFDAWDKNGDGTLSREEVPEGPRRNFDRVDVNKDGVLSREEDQNFRRRMSSRMTDGVLVKRDLPYAGTDNPRQMLDLYLPKESKSEKLPVVVFIHGGGWRNGNKAGGGRQVMPYVQSGYYAGVSVGYRLTNEAQWPSQIHDCKAAIRWLKANAETYNLDPKRIGAWGTSAGGHLVSMLGVTGDVPELEGDLGAHTAFDSSVHCVVNYCGPSRLLTMNDFDSTIDHNAPDSPESLLVGGAIQEHKAKAANASPITHVSKPDARFLTVHGTKDPLVPFNQGEVLHAALKKAGVPSVMITIENGGHGVGRTPQLNELVKSYLDQELRGLRCCAADVTLQADSKRK